MAGSEKLRPIEEYPDISFIDGYTVEQLENDMLQWFKEKRKEITGDDLVMGKADDRRIQLQTAAYFIFQGYMYSDNAGKMGLIKYSYGDFLENLGAFKHIYRKDAVGAATTIRFSLVATRTTTTGIPAGTRLTAGDGVYFATNEYDEIAIGQTQVEIGATCLTPGSDGNNYEVGDIKIIVDPIPFIDQAENITKPENGTDIENDESLRERIYAAPSAYSSAGTEDAWEYFVRERIPSVADVKAFNPEPRLVRVRYLLEGGVIPGEESLMEMLEYLTDPQIKPLTDKVEVLAPETHKYSVNLKYYINRSNRNQAETIQAKVSAAISEYNLWQRTKMGRDVNPDELLRLIRGAGAKRTEITEPVFQVVGEESVAICQVQTVEYGGLEDD